MEKRIPAYERVAHQFRRRKIKRDRFKEIMGCARHNETAAGDLMLEIEADSASLVRDKDRPRQSNLFFGNNSGGGNVGNR